MVDDAPAAPPPAYDDLGLGDDDDDEDLERLGLRDAAPAPAAPATGDGAPPPNQVTRPRPALLPPVRQHVAAARVAGRPDATAALPQLRVRRAGALAGRLREPHQEGGLHAPRHDQPRGDAGPDAAAHARRALRELRPRRGRALPGRVRRLRGVAEPHLRVLRLRVQVGRVISWSEDYYYSKDYYISSSSSPSSKCAVSRGSSNCTTTGRFADSAAPLPSRATLARPDTLPTRPRTARPALCFGWW